MKKFLIVHLLAAVVATVACMPSGRAEDDERTLYVYAWEDAFAPDVLRDFEVENDCLVEIDYFDSDDAMFEKIRLLGSGYDLLVPSNGVAERIFRNGLTRSVDHALIPNLDRLTSRALSLFPDVEMRYFVPYTIAAVCVVYNPRLVPSDALGRWDIFARPGFDKKAAMLNDMRFVMGAALRSLGYGANSVDPGEISEAGDTLQGWKRNVAHFSVKRAREGVVNGEFAFIQTFTGGLLNLTRRNPDLAYFMPDEGSIVNSTGFVIPADTGKSALAHAFVNHMIEPANAAQNMVFNLSYMPNPSARALVPANIIDSINFRVPIEKFMQCESIRDIGEAVDLYETEWLAALLDGEE